MVLTAERTDSMEDPISQRPKRPAAVVAVILVLLIVLVIGIVIVVNAGDDVTPGGGDVISAEPVETVDDVYDRLASALEVLDPANADLTHTGLSDLVRPDLMGWQISTLGLDPVFSDCSGSTSITCALT